MKEHCAECNVPCFELEPGGVCRNCYHAKTLTCDDLIDALKAHKAKHGNTLVAFRGAYGAQETTGVSVLEDPVRIPRKSVREYDEWVKCGKPLVIWTNLG